MSHKNIHFCSSFFIVAVVLYFLFMRILMHAHTHTPLPVLLSPSHFLAPSSLSPLNERTTHAYIDCIRFYNYSHYFVFSPSLFTPTFFVRTNALCITTDRQYKCKLYAPFTFAAAAAYILNSDGVKKSISQNKQFENNKNENRSDFYYFSNLSNKQRIYTACPFRSFIIHTQRTRLRLHIAQIIRL